MADDDHNGAGDRAAGIAAEALRRVFGENESTKRFIDVSRIPLICKSIVDINTSLIEIKNMITDSNRDHVNQDQFWPVKTIVYGAAGLALTALCVALVALVVKQ